MSESSSGTWESIDDVLATVACVAGVVGVGVASELLITRTKRRDNNTKAIGARSARFTEY